MDADDRERSYDREIYEQGGGGERENVEGRENENVKAANAGLY